MGDLDPDKQKYGNQVSLGMFAQKSSFVFKVQLKLKIIDINSVSKSVCR